MQPVSDSLLFEKGLPANPDAERLVLAAALMGQSLVDITAKLDSRDFSIEKHRRIFAAIVHLEATGGAVDCVTVAGELLKVGQLESVDGVSYLLSLTEGMPDIVNIDAYVKIVKDASTRRLAIFTYEKGIRECLEATEPTPEMLTRHQSAIAMLATEMRTASFRTPMEIINQAGGIQAILHPDKRRGIETPWPLLNRMLTNGGFTPGQMIVIGARPSKGKTALACQIAEHAAMRGTGVAFFTLEMQDDAILSRMAAARAQVDGLKVTQSLASKHEIGQLSEAYADLADEDRCKLWIDDTTGCTVPAMRAALRWHTEHHAIGLVVIDYLQLIETTGGSDRRLYEQVTEISRRVKLLAHEFKVPVVVLAQLSRDSVKQGRKPQLSDLRDSGAIEQDADIVLFPHPRDGQEEHADVIEVDLYVAKQRNGPCGMHVPLQFLRRYAKFIEPTSKADAQVA